MKNRGPRYQTSPRFNRVLSASAATGILAALLLLVVSSLPAAGAEYYVHHQIGDDTFDGLSASLEPLGKGPFRTILHALKVAGAGDTVHLVPTDAPYRESVRLNTPPTWCHPGGEPGKPLIIDGHGAVISGAEPCPPEGWEPWQERIYQRDDFPGTQSLTVNGQRVHALEYRDVLQPGDWIYYRPHRHLLYRPNGAIGEITVVFSDGATEIVTPDRWQNAGGKCGARRIVGLAEPEALIVNGRKREPIRVRERLAPGQFSNEEGVLYYYLPEGREIADLEIECVVRQNGVQIGGATAHVVIRNIHAQKVYNDGFNIHQGANNLLFQNVIATYCFDEGYSAHSNVECEIDGAIFMYNASGLTNVGQVRNRARNLIVAFNDGIGYVSLERAVEHVENLILIDNGSQLAAPSLTACNVVAITTGVRRGAGGFGFSGRTVLENLTAIGAHNARTEGSGQIALRNVIFGGPGDWHFRMDDPQARFEAVEHVWIDHRLTVSYGSRYPWTSRNLHKWFKEQHPGAVHVTEIPDGAQLTRPDGSESLPESVGAPAELLRVAIGLLHRYETGENLATFDALNLFCRQIEGNTTEEMTPEFVPVWRDEK